MFRILCKYIYIKHFSLYKKKDVIFIFYFAWHCSQQVDDEDLQVVVNCWVQCWDWTFNINFETNREVFKKLRRTKICNLMRTWSIKEDYVGKPPKSSCQMILWRQFWQMVRRAGMCKTICMSFEPFCTARSLQSQTNKTGTTYVTWQYFKHWLNIGISRYLYWLTSAFLVDIKSLVFHSLQMLQ